MAQYRKKPVVIEAIQWDSSNESWSAIGLLAASEDVIFLCGDGTLEVCTLEGNMTASHGDWIIRGVQGEQYPCKPDIFEATHEAVEPDTVQHSAN